MTTNTKHVSVNQFMRALADELGLKKFKTEVVLDPGYERSARVYFSHDLKIDRLEDEVAFLNKNVGTIFDDIKGSAFVTGLTNELTKKLEAKNQEVTDLLREIDRLRIFEHHYQVAMKLAHGD